MKFSFLVAASLLLSTLVFAQGKTHTFTLGDQNFMLDGKPFQVISGEIHYPRVPQEAWRARMKMAKAMGLNTIGTYVFWNVHEAQKGKYDFTGNNDIAKFVQIAAEEGLWVILRPSPYVCAEWEFGGYPYWLQNEKGLVVRSTEAKYLKAYQNYIMAVGKQLAPLQVNHGGNILMVQIENEYGSYGNDKNYLNINKELFIKAGFDGLLYTCDPESDMKAGHLPGLLPAINGQDQPDKVKKAVNILHDGKGPYFIAEWYPAWFDWWGAAHHTVPAENYSKKLDDVLKAGISINMYMFHGGSTRGFMNGANYKDTSPYEPQISSYDYDAPLDEAGNATEKFMKFREVIAKYLPTLATLPAVPKAKPSMHIPEFSLTASASIFDMLPKPVKNAGPLSFESLKQAYGYVLYKTIIKGGRKGMLKIKQLRDYGAIYLNGNRVGLLDRRFNQDSLALDLPAGDIELAILVENMGRINFGKYMLQNTKGITESVHFAGQELKNWEMYSLPFASAPKVKANTKVDPKHNQPMLKSGSFELEQVADTYLDMRKWGKGVVWVNGRNLGRYWSIGPQQTLYLPAEWLKKGKNDIVVFDLIESNQNHISSLDKAILNQLKK